MISGIKVIVRDRDIYIYIIIYWDGAVKNKYIIFKWYYAAYK